MTTVSILYFSGTGHTAKLAEAVHKRAAAVPGVQAELIPLSGDDILKGRYQNEAVLAKLDASDAIIFGSPTYMGGPAAQFKAFADATGGRWYGGAWRDKLAAGFTVSSGPSGDKLSTLHYFFTLAMQHGMLWAGFPETPMNDKGINRLSSYSGVMAQAGQEPADVAPNAADKLTGELLGQRVAVAAARWKR
ncbi:MAG TPA: flavodoxin family protein [Verrucomicrobiales bacterium]|nr:flavodoxin family protein [Verrucomicrobiales bacterium]